MLAGQARQGVASAYASALTRIWSSGAEPLAGTRAGVDATDLIFSHRRSSGRNASSLTANIGLGRRAISAMLAQRRDAQPSEPRWSPASVLTLYTATDRSRSRVLGSCLEFLRRVGRRLAAASERMEEARREYDRDMVAGSEGARSRSLIDLPLITDPASSSPRSDMC